MSWQLPDQWDPQDDMPVTWRGWLFISAVLVLILTLLVITP